jgi:hypothetical protein
VACAPTAAGVAHDPSLSVAVGLALHRFKEAA